MKLRYAACFLLAAALLAGLQRPGESEKQLEAAIHKEAVQGDLKGAIAQYNKILAQKGTPRPVAARALFQLGQCQEKLGQAEARKAYERLVKDYGDQAEIVAQARARLTALGGAGGAGGLVARQVLADASGVSGVLTADGQYIRYIDPGTGDVVQFEVASGRSSRITNRGEAERGIERYVFSRDGKQIVYDRSKDGIREVRIRNLDGSSLRTLYSEKSYQLYPLAWSPDAGSILALRGEAINANELVLISTADGSVRVLRSIASAWLMLERASFSPDGRFVAFSLVREGSPPHADVFLMTADSRNEVVVAGHPAEDRLLGWTPDGRSLVFLSDRSGTWDIWTVHITGGKQQGEPELLKKDFGRDSKVVGFAPDGSLYYRTVTPAGGLFYGTVDLETGKVLVPPEPVATRSGPPMYPTWSPDGRRLLYVSSGGSLDNEHNILTIRSIETGEEHFLSPHLRYVVDISWAPDGRSVLALGTTEKEIGLFRIDAETSEITKLAGEGRAPKLCPDGKTLVFVAPGSIITKRNLDTGEESVVAKIGQVSYGLSPDGREVVFNADGAVKTVSLNGGEPRELFRGSARWYWLRWPGNGRYIIAQGGGEIWRIPAQGGTPLKLDFFVPGMDMISIHPDNRRFAFSVRIWEGSKSELWVLENLLPAAKAAK